MTSTGTKGRFLFLIEQFSIGKRYSKGTWDIKPKSTECGGFILSNHSSGIEIPGTGARTLVSGILQAVHF